MELPEGDADRTSRPANQAGWDRRRELEKRLHDGPALRLAAATLRVGVCRNLVRPDQPELRDQLAAVQDELHSVQQELREVFSQIYPPMLATAGLGAALEALAERIGMPVTVHAPEERYSAAVEAAAYFAVTERLSSLVDSATAARVVVRRAGSQVELTIAASGADSAADTEELVRIPCE